MVERKLSQAHLRLKSFIANSKLSINCRKMIQKHYCFIVKEEKHEHGEALVFLNLPSVLLLVFGGIPAV